MLNVVVVGIDALLAGMFATYGLAYSVKWLAGPFAWFEKLRMWGDVRGGWIQHGLYCEICLSFWIGIPMALVVCGFTSKAIAHWLSYVFFALVANVVLNRIRTFKK